MYLRICSKPSHGVTSLTWRRSYFWRRIFYHFPLILLPNLTGSFIHYNSMFAGFKNIWTHIVHVTIAAEEVLSDLATCLGVIHISIHLAFLYMDLSNLSFALRHCSLLVLLSSIAFWRRSWEFFSRGGLGRVDHVRSWIASFNFCCDIYRIGAFCIRSVKISTFFRLASAVLYLAFTFVWPYFFNIRLFIIYINLFRLFIHYLFIYWSSSSLL